MEAKRIGTIALPITDSPEDKAFLKDFNKKKAARGLRSNTSYLRILVGEDNPARKT